MYFRFCCALHSVEMIRNEELNLQELYCENPKHWYYWCKTWGSNSSAARYSDLLHCSTVSLCKQFLTCPRNQESKIAHYILRWLGQHLFMDIPVLWTKSNQFKYLMTASYAILPWGAPVSLLRPQWLHVAGPFWTDQTRTLTTLAPLLSLTMLPQAVKYAMWRLYCHCHPAEIHYLSLMSAVLTCWDPLAWNFINVGQPCRDMIRPPSSTSA